MTISEPRARLGSYDPFAPVDDAALQQKSRDHLWMHFARHGANQAGADVPIMVRGEGHHSTTATARSTSTGSPACSSSPPARPEAPGRDGREAGRDPVVLPDLVVRAPRRDRARRPARRPRPGDLNKVFFSTGGGEAVETAFKLAKYYWKLRGKPMKHKVISRAVAYHGTPQGRPRDHGHPGDEADVRAAHPRRLPGPEHQLLPRCGDGFAGGSERSSASGRPSASAR